MAVSREPSGRNGVTIAVSTVPNRAGASNPAVLTVFRLPGAGKGFAPASVRVGTPTRPCICATLAEKAAGSGKRAPTQASVANGLVATSVPSARAEISKSANTAGAAPAS
ncbi:hypothetical protein MyChFU_48880 [Mycobacterium intracellulare subsp. chimaera]